MFRLYPWRILRYARYIGSAIVRVENVDPIAAGAVDAPRAPPKVLRFAPISLFRRSGPAQRIADMRIFAPELPKAADRRKQSCRGRCAAPLRIAFRM
jgi:hypothetical protein